MSAPTRDTRRTREMAEDRRRGRILQARVRAAQEELRKRDWGRDWTALDRAMVDECQRIRQEALEEWGRDAMENATRAWWQISCEDRDARSAARINRTPA